jgi:hypothetical protein
VRAVLTSVVAFVALMLIRPALGGWIGRYELGVILVLSIASGSLAMRYRMTVVLLALPAPASRSQLGS